MVKSSKLIKELLTRSIVHAADYQQDLIQLVRRVSAIAEVAYTRRDFHTVKEVSGLLIALPLPQARSTGLWYQAICKRREGWLTEAVQNLEELLVNRHAKPIFKARALQTLGAIQEDIGYLDVARQLYTESAQYIRRESPEDAYTFANSAILHSVTRSNEDDSQQALSELLNIESLVKIIRDPLLTATYCNNIAVELLVLGQVSEASSYSRAACLSPLAFAYPEWKETALEIEQQTAKKNTVALAVSPEPQKRSVRPKFLLVVLQFSPSLRVTRPIEFRRRVSCNNPTVALIALVVRIRAPSL